MKFNQVRIARPVTSLKKSAEMYRTGLGLEEIDGFTNHEGFSGVMLGEKGGNWHLEFTICHHHQLSPTPSADDLLVFYISNINEWHQICSNMDTAGFIRVKSFNPYWMTYGETFEDHDGYRTVISLVSL